MTDGAVRKGEKRPRPCGLIYQQSTSGMIPEGLGMLNKKNRSRREEIPRVKSDGGSRNGPKVEGCGGCVLTAMVFMEAVKILGRFSCYHGLFKGGKTSKIHVFPSMFICDFHFFKELSNVTPTTPDLFLLGKDRFRQFCFLVTTRRFSILLSSL